MCYNVVMNEENLEQSIHDTLTRFSEAELVITMAIGAAVLLAGYRIKKIAFFIVWFIIGLNLAHYLLPWFNSTVPAIKDNDLWQNLIPVAGGLLLALMGFSIEKVCVAGIAFALTMVITGQYFGTEAQTLVIGAVVGVVAAGAAVMMMKPAIIILTSLAGAYVITVGTIQLSDVGQDVYFPMLIGITIFGTVTQFLTTKHL